MGDLSSGGADPVIYHSRDRPPKLVSIRSGRKYGLALMLWSIACAKAMSVSMQQGSFGTSFHFRDSMAGDFSLRPSSPSVASLNPYVRIFQDRDANTLPVVAFLRLCRCVCAYKLCRMPGARGFMQRLQARIRLSTESRTKRTFQVELIGLNSQESLLRHWRK
jgi:hypothetical protein